MGKYLLKKVGDHCYPIRVSEKWQQSTDPPHSSTGVFFFFFLLKMQASMRFIPIVTWQIQLFLLLPSAMLALNCLAWWLYSEKIVTSNCFRHADFITFLSKDTWTIQILYSIQFSCPCLQRFIFLICPNFSYHIAKHIMKKKKSLSSRAPKHWHLIPAPCSHIVDLRLSHVCSLFSLIKLILGLSPPS